MASAICATHPFHPAAHRGRQAGATGEILAEGSTRPVGEQVATKQDLALLRADLELLRTVITAMEQRIKTG